MKEVACHDPQEEVGQGGWRPGVTYLKLGVLGSQTSWGTPCGYLHCSRLSEVFRCVAESLGQFVHNLFEYQSIDVLAQHVEEEPVPHLALPDYGVDDFLVDEAEAQTQEVGPHARTEDDHEAVQQHEEREEHQQQKPKPEEDVDLLVDDVDGEDAQGVVLLQLPRGAELTEGALGHAREHEDHGIYPHLLVIFHELDHVQAEGEEGVAQEPIDQEHLAWKE